jgi:diguanylate cyclase (GGDEF)-like protein
MRVPNWMGVLFVPIALNHVTWALGTPDSGPNLHTLVTTQEIHSLSKEEAARAYPVHLHAVVTYFDSELNEFPDLFVCDNTGCIFVEFSEMPKLALRPGDVVDVSGVSGSGDYAPVIDQPVVHWMGHSHLPERAQEATLADLVSGSFDGQWVEIAGVVHAVHYTPTNVTLDIEAAGGSLRATTLRETHVDYEALVDCLIRIRGNMAPVFNWQSQMVGAQLVFPGVETIKIDEPAPKTPFLLPVIPLAQLSRFSPSIKIPHRVHVRGRVNLLWPGRVLCIQQQNNSLCMDTAQADPVRLGALADAIGFPATIAYKQTLENATFRIENGSSGPQLVIRPATADQAINGDVDGQLVQISGQILDVERASGDIRILIRSGSILIPAIIPASMAAEGLRAWKEGSDVLVSGLCNSQAAMETWNLRNGAVRPGEVQILLRSASDLRVVKSPSWWTPQNASQVATGAGLVFLAAAAWVIILRRRVDQQTRALRSSEEKLRHLSEHDALTDLPNRILLQDRMQVALLRSERFHEPLGVLMVDIDRFKQVNDSYGHHAGDELLRVIAKRIGSSVRKTDTVARIGGDEFVVLLPDLRKPQEAEMIGSKILDAVSSPIDLGVATVSVTVSIGVSTYPEGGKDGEGLLRSADAAMYSAKTSGRNALHVTMLTAAHESCSL